MERIKTSDVEKLISINFRINLHLTNQFNYYKTQRNRRTIITYSNIENHSIIEDEIFLVGNPILQIFNKHNIIFPTILNLLTDNIKTISIFKNLQVKVSFGKSVILKEENGQYLLCNKLGRKISLGIINNEIFQPIVDIGMYLRDEKIHSN